MTGGQLRPALAGTTPPIPGVGQAAAGDPTRALGALVATARRRGYTITRSADGTEVSTDIGQREIIIPATFPPAAAAAVAAAEIAHLVAGAELTHLAATTKIANLPDGTTVSRDGAAAVEAASVAWIVLARLGLDPAGAGLAFPPAQIWAAPDPRSPLTGVIAAAGERITRMAIAVSAHAEKVLATIPPASAVPPAPVTVPVRAQTAAAPPRKPPPAAVSAAAWPHPGQALIAVNMAAVAFYRAQLPQSGWAQEYLARRGFGPDICRPWQLGYAPGEWTGLLDHLRRAGYADELIQRAGLARVSSRGTLIDIFRDRIMIPLRGPHGQVIAFAGRAPDGAPEGTPKYLNTGETPAFRKGEVLYGLAEAGAALDAGARPVLTEGYLDHIAVTVVGGGRLAGLSTGGTSLSDRQMTGLAAACDLARTPLLDVRDADTGGRKATSRDYPIITPFSPGAGAVLLPRKDPAAVFEHDGPQALMAALTGAEVPLADVAVDAALAPWEGKRQWAEGQLGAVRAAAQLLASCPPPNPARQIARVAEWTGVPHADVAAEFAVAAAGVTAPKAAGADARPPARQQAEPRATDFPAQPAPGRQRPPPRRGPSAARHAGGRRPPRR